MFTRLYVINGYFDDSYTFRIRSLIKICLSFDLKRANNFKLRVQRALLWFERYLSYFVYYYYSVFNKRTLFVVGLFRSVPFLLPAEPPYWTHHSCRAEVVLWLVQPAHARDAASLCALVVASYPAQHCNYNLCPLHSCPAAMHSGVAQRMHFNLHKYTVIE